MTKIALSIFDDNMAPLLRTGDVIIVDTDAENIDGFILTRIEESIVFFTHPIFPLETISGTLVATHHFF